MKCLTLQDVNVIQLKPLQTSFDSIKDVLVQILRRACLDCNVEPHRTLRLKLCRLANPYSSGGRPVLMMETAGDSCTTK